VIAILEVPDLLLDDLENQKLDFFEKKFPELSRRTKNGA
jgi:hypothetical protein